MPSFWLLNSYLFISTLLLLQFFSMCAPVYVHVHHVCARATDSRRGRQTPRNWDYRWLWVAMWDLELTLGFSAGAVSTFNRWAISLALISTFPLYLFYVILLISVFLQYRILNPGPHHTRQMPALYHSTAPLLSHFLSYQRFSQWSTLA